jgi:sugar lactone lactonase YvrE
MRKPLSGIFIVIIFIAVLITATVGCKKTNTVVPSIPIVATNAMVSEVGPTTAISGGLIVSLDPVITNGMCYSTTNSAPTLADSKTTDSIAQVMVSKLSGLTPNTTYYMRAYATSVAGTGYGGVITFKTATATATRTAVVTTLAGSSTGAYGYADGSGTGVLFDGPQGLTFNPTTGLIYVTDAYNNAIRTLTTTGTSRTLTNRTLGYQDGPLATALFYGARGMTVDAQGNVYVADQGNNNIRKITPAGVVSTYSGNGTAGYVDGTGSVVRFNTPQDIAIDAQGNAYVADRNNNSIRKITPTGSVSTFAGNSLPGLNDNTGTLAEFNYPSAVAVDAQSNVYVADARNKAIRKITPAGVVTTLAGGTLYPNIIGTPSGIAVDAQGNVFISEQSGRILEITAAGVLYTVAGSLNTAGYVNGTGAAARFNVPQDITVDAQGNLYVADYNNNAIRKIVLTVTP